MSYPLTKAVQRAGPDDPLLRLLLLVLALHADRQGVAAGMGLGAILHETGLDRDTAICTLEALRVEGWFTYPKPKTFHLSLAKLHVVRPPVPSAVKFHTWTCELCGALRNTRQMEGQR